jgi:hypothetical protein
MSSTEPVLAVPTGDLSVAFETTLDAEVAARLATCPDCGQRVVELRLEDGETGRFNKAEGVRQLALGPPKSPDPRDDYELKSYPLACVVIPHHFVCLRLKRAEVVRMRRR